MAFAVVKGLGECFHLTMSGAMACEWPSIPRQVSMCQCSRLVWKGLIYMASDVADGDMMLLVNVVLLLGCDVFSRFLARLLQREMTTDCQ